MQYTDFNWKGECFLIADDDHYNHLLLNKVLVKTGAKVIHAYNGKDAIDILINNKGITIALLDIVMPDFSGFDVIRQTKSDCLSVQYFAFTADIFRVNEAHCKELGFLRCFAKPMLPARLFTEIQASLPVRAKL